ncbi:pathogenesis-related 1 [Olea europaea subsp. europaea]|uniref:Pathogenesis-related 1 n=1 Tax=Olea europaea subsp. europaea TaxID=158383 RepID=A0A8S0Q1N9_OLEEU|nr:pathogenesis-related 1 [Olea europaea subsp. europaea]
MGSCYVVFTCLVILFGTNSALAQNTIQDYLAVHNAARARVGVGSMRWDNKLATYARNYADKIKGRCLFQHSNGPYGENLALGTTMTGRQAVNLWVAERKDYNYRSNSCSGTCGHYTQVVWRKSVRLGCARVRCNNGNWFVICNYDPRGNISEQRPY